MPKITSDQEELLESYEPVKIGVIGYTGDSEEQMRGEEGGPAAAIRLALQEAWDSCKLPRKVELLWKPDHGLPNGQAINDVRAYEELCDAGCLCVVGPHSSDNIYMMREASDRRKVPVISWAGTESLAGEYLFRLGNGDCGGDPALIARWCEKKGFTNIGIIEELCPNGEEYMRYFRLECRERELHICSTETLAQTSSKKAVREALARLRDSGADVLVYIGYGYLLSQNFLNPALKKLAWDPPRITTTAFMFYLTGYNSFEGWVGVDQDCPLNPLRNHFEEAFYPLYRDSMWLDRRDNWMNGVQLLAYDTGRVIAEALYRAPRLTPDGIRQGLERIRWMPAAVGGPNTHISCSAFEHNMYSGDWLCYGKVENMKLVYEGLYEDE